MNSEKESFEADLFVCNNLYLVFLAKSAKNDLQ